MYRWKGIKRYISRPKFLKNLVLNPEKQICNHLVTAHQASQKNHNRFWLRFFPSTSDTCHKWCSMGPCHFVMCTLADDTSLERHPPTFLKRWETMGLR